MGKANISARELRQAKANGGSLVLPLPGAVGQRRRKYFNQYNEELLLPGDARNLEFYLEHKGFTLQPRPDPLVREATIGIEDWDGSKQHVEVDAMPAAAATPTATYFTQDGTPVPNLPADPESMAAYLQQGLSLSPPEGVAPARPQLQLVKPVSEPKSHRGRGRFRRTG